MLEEKNPVAIAEAHSMRYFCINSVRDTGRIKKAHIRTVFGFQGI